MLGWLACPASVVRANTNACVGQPWPQQASPDAREGTVALNWCLRPPRIRRVGQARTSLAHPTPLLLSCVATGLRRRQAGQTHCSCGLRGHGSQKGAFGKATVARLLVGQGLSSRPKREGKTSITESLPGHRSSPLSRSTRAASQAWGWQTPAIGGLLRSQRANPSVKGTCLRQAPYVER